MLSSLHVKNIAIIEELSIDFESGFSVFTGETGAGKSIIIDAIGLLLGGRGTKDLIRSGEQKAEVSAVFSGLLDVAAELSEIGSAPDENGELLISREITAEGKSSCKAGGKPVTASILKAAAPILADIYGQHESGALLDADKHIIFLDNFANIQNEKEEYAKAYLHVKVLKQKLRASQMSEDEKSRRIALLDLQIKELKEASITAGEAEELSEKLKILRSSEKITEAVDKVFSLFDGGDEGAGVKELLAKSEKSIAQISDVSEPLSKLNDKLKEIIFMAEDCTDLALRARPHDFEKGELELFEDRLALINRLQKKYGPDLSVYLDEIEKEKEDILEKSAQTEEIRSDLYSAVAVLKEEAEKLTKRRKQAAQSLNKRIIDELSGLEMTKCAFEVSITKAGSGEKILYGQDGCDKVEFLLSANAGEELKPLSKIASGGELSRIMLAFKSVFTNEKTPKTMIFDEIDTGVSGSAAEKIGKKMAEISNNKQVFCVTHLSQIAALAESHYLIKKSTANERTKTTLSLLDRDGRIKELARMISGETVSDVAFENAKEMIKNNKNI